MEHCVLYVSIVSGHLLNVNFVFVVDHILHIIQTKKISMRTSIHFVALSVERKLKTTTAIGQFSMLKARNHMCPNLVPLYSAIPMKKSQKL